MKRQTYPAPERHCYWTKDEDGDPVLIPQCWGSLYDPGQCTCDVPGSRLEQAEAGRAAAEREVERLREKLHRQHDRYQVEFNMNWRLRQRVSELERADRDREKLLAVVAERKG